MNNLNDIKSILVIKLRHIGDVLLTTALFAALKQQFSGARVCALVYANTAEMLTDNPDIDTVYTYDQSLKKAGRLNRVKGELALLARLRRERFDMVINLTEGDRGAIVALLSGARWRFGMDARGTGLIGKNRIYTHLMPRVTPGLHAVEQNLECLRMLGVKPSALRVSFHFSDDDKNAAQKQLGVIGLKAGVFFQAHMTSRWMFKTMPPEVAAACLDMMIERSGVPCLITASPEQKEREYLDKMLPAMKCKDVPVISGVSLKQLGALTSMALFFVGVDSAPMHIAASLNIPVFGVFGPSSVRIWGPWDNSLLGNPYKQARGIQVTGTHMVLQSNRECVPCLRDGCNGSKKSDCLAVSLNELQSAVNAFNNNLRLIYQNSMVESPLKTGRIKDNYVF